MIRFIDSAPKTFEVRIPVSQASVSACATGIFSELTSVTVWSLESKTPSLSSPATVEGELRHSRLENAQLVRNWWIEGEVYFKREQSR